MMPVFENAGLKTQGWQMLSKCYITYQMYVGMRTQEVLGPPLQGHQLDQAIEHFKASLKFTEIISFITLKFKMSHF